MSAQTARKNSGRNQRASSASLVEHAALSHENKESTWDNWIPVGLLAIVFVAYLPAIQGNFIWDDDSYITKNETLRSADGLRRIWFEIGATPQYYPLVFTTFWIENHLWGLSPAGYHIVNILLHAASAILVWRIVQKLKIPGASLAAFIFAVHPVHVESVAWITERKNVLSGFFYLCSMSAFLRFSPTNDDSEPRRKWYFFSLLFFVAALLSKTVTASLPAALLLIYWFKSGRLRPREILAVLPMFALGAVAGSVTAYVEKHHVGTKFLEMDYGAIDRILIAGRVVWFYFAKLLWPASLTFIYPRWQINAEDIVQYLYPLAAFALICLLGVMYRSWGRGPLVAALFFGGTLFPALGFVNVFPMRYSFVADHFQYLASLGPIVLAAALITRHLPRPGLKPASISILALLGVLTFRQCKTYKDLETLWRDTLAKNPRATMARNNLGAILQKQGKLNEAEDCYNQCLGDPKCQDRADVLFNLAVVAQARGDMPLTISYLQKAITERPSYPKALTNLGGLLHNLGRVDEAVIYLERAIKSNPDYFLARNNLGSALLSLGRTQEAIDQFQLAIKLKPDFAEAHYNLGNALFKVNRMNEAQSEFLTALTLRSDYVEAYVNLANLLQQSGKLNEAVVQLKKALDIDPQHPIAHYGLANALVRQGRKDEAMLHYQAAQRIRPDLRPPAGF